MILLTLSEDAVLMLASLMKRVEPAYQSKAEQVDAAIARGIVNPHTDHVGVFLSWPVWPSSMAGDLAAIEEIRMAVEPYVEP